MDPLAGSAARDMETAEQLVNLRDPVAVRALLPQFRLPRGVRAALPTRLHYLHAMVPEAAAPLTQLVTNPPMDGAGLQYTCVLRGGCGAAARLHAGAVRVHRTDRLGRWCRLARLCWPGPLRDLRFV